MRFILDRFEKGYAVCENMETREVSEYPAESLPEGASPGDMLIYDGAGFTIDRGAARVRHKRIKKMFEDLWG